MKIYNESFFGGAFNQKTVLPETYALSEPEREHIKKHFPSSTHEKWGENSDYVLPHNSYVTHIPVEGKKNSIAFYKTDDGLKAGISHYANKHDKHPLFHKVLPADTSEHMDAIKKFGA